MPNVGPCASAEVPISTTINGKRFAKREPLVTLPSLAMCHG